MNPVVRLLGRILNLVGISSPEDATAKKSASLPSWKAAAEPRKAGENPPGKKQ